MNVRVTIDLGLIPKRKLIECREDIQKMIEEFSSKHPDIEIPSEAVRIEGSLFGINFSRGIY